MTDNQRTRYCIETALLKLMEEKPITQITVTDITDKAGVARASFYRNYHGKEDVIQQFLQRERKDFWGDMGFIPRSREDYRLIVREIFVHAQGMRDKYKAFRKSHMEFVLFEHLMLTSLDRMGALRSNEHTRFYAPGYAGALLGVLFAWLEEDCVTPVDDVTSVLLGILFPQEDEATRIQAGVTVALMK